MRWLNIFSHLIIDTESDYCSDELETRFYACPYCHYERVPYGLSAWQSEPYENGEGRVTRFDAKYCPGCGRKIAWLTESQT